MIKTISTKHSGRQVIYYENNGEKFSIGYKTLRRFFNEDRYSLDEMPKEIKSRAILEITGIKDDNPELSFGTILFIKDEMYLCKESLFHSNKLTTEGDNEFNSIL